MISSYGPAILDLNTQSDLFGADGRYRLHNAQGIAENIKRLFVYLRSIRCLVVSTRLHHAIMPDRSAAVPICVPGDPGYAKLPFTLLPQCSEMPVDCGTDLPVQTFHDAQQYIFDLPDPNPFESPRLDRLLSEIEVSTWLLIGGPLEVSVRMAVLGLLQRRKNVAIIKDCMGQRDAYEAEMAVRQVESKNIQWLTVDEVIERCSRKPVRRARLLARVAQRARRAAAAPKPTYRGRSKEVAHGYRLRD
ncbi:MAG: isochorismatase family protein [Phycisphaerae bacterium]